MTTCHVEPCAEALEFKSGTCNLCIPHIREGQLAVFTQWGFVPLWTPHQAELSPTKRKSTAPATKPKKPKKPKAVDLQCHEVLQKTVDLQCHEVLPETADLHEMLPEVVTPRVVSREARDIVLSPMCKMPRVEDVMCPPSFCEEDMDAINFSIDDWMCMLSHTPDSLCTGVEVAVREMHALFT